MVAADCVAETTFALPAGAGCLIGAAAEAIFFGAGEPAFSATVFFDLGVRVGAGDVCV